MRRIQLALVVAALLVPAAARAQPVVFVVRHAERADAGMAAGSSTDPDLSETGRARAAALAAMLKDARIEQIFVTEYKRTRQTAEPLAKLLGIDPTVIVSKDMPGLTSRMTAATGNILVVGHTNTIPAIIKALKVEDALVVGDSEYDHLFVVIRTQTPSLLRLRYR